MSPKLQTSQVDRQKAERAILYICEKMHNGCEGFGSTMLNKALFYADHVHYIKRGKKITGFAYIKQERGPTPKPEEFIPIRENLISENKLEIRLKEFWGKTQKRPVTLKPLTADELNESFAPDEIADMDEVIAFFSKSNGKFASDFSHKDIGWEFAELFEEIPASVSLLSRADLTEEDVSWGEEQIANCEPAHC